MEKKKSIVKFIILTVVILVVLNILFFVFTGGRGFKHSIHANGLHPFEKKIGLVTVNGGIFSSKYIVETLKSYADNDDVKVILIRIDSPGGGVAVCQEISEAMYEARKKGKTIFVSFGSVAASGGYYIASAADTIYTNPGTLTGSIGVIMEYTDFADLFKKIGISEEVVKSGKFKDIGNPARKSTPEETKILQDVIDDVYGQFVDAIMKGRVEKIKTALRLNKQIKEPTNDDAKKFLMSIADGRIFSGKQAKDYGLVDEIGSYDDCLKAAAERSGISGEPAVISDKRKVTIFDLITGNQDTDDSMIHKLFFKGFCFLYGS